MSLEAFGDETWPQSDAVAATEMLLSMPPRYTRGLVVNRPHTHSRRMRLAQAAMWREYAMTWHGRKTKHGINQDWCERIGKWTYDGCIRRAKINMYLASRFKRQT